ncbi:Oidioi.mRNA.OKI2018_I69.PAR.g9574.t1.cds [Oikopleura dioica]|uniref:Isoaspartyl peptidase/L-asparaginase n=1 Tax=Oikopleura dioica TaxID=34765 RepID=A0ABN7RQI6_OIKDI|nr:Oidioi.mRNA.OKI2018_I69.PAR.g9574.t1.cds [Oikopleura dioica]
MVKLKIICHGGAWSIPDDAKEKSLEGIQRAARAGIEALKKGDKSEDAVVSAVTVMENDPIFNAGHGGSLTRDGTVELDAMVMRGRDSSIGAVAALRNVKNACQVARKVMDSEHTLIVGPGATEFAKEKGFEIIDDSTLVTPYEKAALEKIRHYGTGVESIFKAGEAHDTVGAVGFDGEGFSCCTSTGGVTFKRPGRVGDSPLAGSGGWADGGAACSTTGHGEGITKALLAHRVVWGCGADQSRASAAVDDALDFMKTQIGSQGGAICLTRASFGVGFNTKRMPWCYISFDTETREEECIFGIEPASLDQREMPEIIENYRRKEGNRQTNWFQRSKLVRFHLRRLREKSMNKSMNLPGNNVSTSESLQFKVLVKKRSQKPRRKIYVIMTIGSILMTIGLVLTVMHFTKEDILGLEEAKRLFNSMPTEPPITYKSESINISEIMDNPEELTKYTALKVEESKIAAYPAELPTKTINPLSLPFFMASTIIVSFGIVFILVGTTWWKIVVDKENAKNKG